MSNHFNYHCAICKKPLIGSTDCCGYEYIIDNDRIIYEHEKMLLNYFPNDFILNKTLNTNGHLSYFLLPEGSVSLPERNDVRAFSEYIQKFYKKGNILDVGCGPLENPGYLDLIKINHNQFFGLDPIPNIAFNGKKIIGSIEFLPCPDESFDTLIFATTLDHVCNLSKTFKEIYRVLKPNGRAIFWHFSNEAPFQNWLRKVKIRFIKKMRYYPYSGNISFSIPIGAIDPYHRDYISLKKIKKLIRTNKFKLENLISNQQNEFNPKTNYFFVLNKYK